MIPAANCVLSAKNVRRTPASQSSLDQFKADIASRGVLQNLIDFAIPKKRGNSRSPLAAVACLQCPLQHLLPRARVFYVLAINATDVANLAYATRLGLWGPDTAFESCENFVQQMRTAGIAAIELVARDLKALGLLISAES